MGGVGCWRRSLAGDLRREKIGKAYLMVTSHSTPPQTPAMVGSCGFLRQLWSFTDQPWMDFSSTQFLYLPLNPCKLTPFKRCCGQRKWVHLLEKVTKCYKVLRWYQQLTTERSGSSIHSCTPSTESPFHPSLAPSAVLGWAFHSPFHCSLYTGQSEHSSHDLSTQSMGCSYSYHTVQDTPTGEKNP